MVANAKWSQCNVLTCNIARDKCPDKCMAVCLELWVHLTSDSLCQHTVLTHQSSDMQESIAVVCNIADLVDGALQGFPVTVFAFGQTGSVSCSPDFCMNPVCRCRVAVTIMLSKSANPSHLHMSLHVDAKNLFTMSGCARLLTDSIMISSCIMALVLYYHDAQRFVGMVCSQCSLSAMYDTWSRVAHSTLHQHISTAFLPARKHVLRHTKSCHRHTAGLLPQTALLPHTIDTGLHFFRPWTFFSHFSHCSIRTGYLMINGVVREGARGGRGEGGRGAREVPQINSLTFVYLHILQPLQQRP